MEAGFEIILGSELECAISLANTVTYLDSLSLRKIWKLEKYDGQDINVLQDPVTGVSLSGRIYNIEFDAETNRIAGRSGCNRFRGLYNLHYDNISFHGFITTKMACPDLAFDNIFINTLVDINKCWVIGNKLYFLRDNRVMMEFSTGN